MPVREAENPTALPGNSRYGMCGKRRCSKKDGHRMMDTECAAGPVPRIP